MKLSRVWAYITVEICLATWLSHFELTALLLERIDLISEGAGAQYYASIDTWNYDDSLGLNQSPKTSAFPKGKGWSAAMCTRTAVTLKPKDGGRQMSDVPAFPDFRPIELEDKELLSAYLESTQPQISEYTFTNLYVWRKSDRPLLSRHGDTLLVKVLKCPDEREVLLPPLGLREPLIELPEFIRELGKQEKIPPIYGISKDQAEALARIGFSVKLDRDNSDYVYLIEDLIKLPGTKFHSKRQSIRRCLSERKCEYVPIDADIVELCLQLQEEWCNLANCRESLGLREEDQAIRETFLNYDKLNAFGAAVSVDGEIQAFTVGERLNKDTAVIHFEKANPKIRGLYQVINQWFCKNALADYKYVNREQDLGEPGIRRAKQSYHPHHMVEKYIAEQA